MINLMRILVRLVLNWKFLEIISRFCATLSAIGCTYTYIYVYVYTYTYICIHYIHVVVHLEFLKCPLSPGFTMYADWRLTFEKFYMIRLQKMYVCIYIYVYTYTYICIHYIYIWIAHRIYTHIHITTPLTMRSYGVRLYSVSSDVSWFDWESLAIIWVPEYLLTMWSYGVASVSRIDKTIGLLCKRAL